MSAGPDPDAVAPRPAPPQPRFVPDWERRFRAPVLMFPRWARDAPERLAILTNESGSYQVHAWDRARDLRRRVTDHPIGVLGSALPTPDGEGIVWFHDETGSEVGRWVVEPFLGDGRERRSLVEGVPEAWSAGLAMGEGLTVVGTADDEGFGVWLARGGGPAALIHRHRESVHVVGLSRDGSLLCLQHAEHGDNIHHALRVIDPGTGRVVGEQWDGERLGLTAAGWSRVPGDQRLAFVHERDGLDRPGVWDLATGERRDIALELPGDVSVAGWWNDGSALLLVHEHEGQSELYRLGLDRPDPTPERISHPEGTISGAAVRPDGTVWYRIASGATPPSIRGDADGAEVIAPAGDPAPEGQPYRSWWFTNPHAERVHGFVVTPATPGPHPIVMDVHGGPTWAYTDTFMPHVQAWVDHGYAVAMVNYRGSTGYGVRFRDSLIGNPGFPEVEDVVAGLDALVADGVADPERAVVTGGSWGGYVTLMCAGLTPERWSAAVAVVPVADYDAAFEDEGTELQAFDRSLFGGSPEEVPDLYRERSPITYVDRVRAPLFIIAGDHDSRCPIRQVLNYVERLQARGHPVEMYRFEAGHGSLVVEERLRQMAAALAFVTSRVPPR